MNSKDKETRSSRLSWGILIGAISALFAWSFRQLKAHGSAERLRPTSGPAPARAANQVNANFRITTGSSGPTSIDRINPKEPTIGSAFSQLKADFRRFPPQELARKLWARLSDHEVTTLSTSFAYHWVFAIPPLLILIVMIAALMNKATDVQVIENILQLIDERAPADTRPLLRDLVDNAVAQVNGSVASFGAIVTALIALWSGSNAVAILITGFNRAYEVEESRSLVRRKVLTLGLTLVLVVFVNLAIALLLFGRQIGEWLADKLGLGSAFDLSWTIARWPIAILGFMLLGAVLYWAGPNLEQPYRWVSLGSVVATTLWLLLVAAFGLYLLLANPASAYGALGSIIVLLVFLNFTGIIFFLGAEVAAILFRAAEEESSIAHIG